MLSILVDIVTTIFEYKYTSNSSSSIMDINDVKAKDFLAGGNLSEYTSKTVGAYSNLTDSNWQGDRTQFHYELNPKTGKYQYYNEITSYFKLGYNDKTGTYYYY
jgi:hypothetical protein